MLVLSMHPVQRHWLLPVPPRTQDPQPQAHGAGEQVEQAEQAEQVEQAEQAEQVEQVEQAAQASLSARQALPPASGHTPDDSSQTLCLSALSCTYYLTRWEMMAFVC